MLPSREQTDLLLATDPELKGLDAERFHLDLTELRAEAEAIARKIGSAEGTASELLRTLVGFVAHFNSHWASLVEHSGWQDVYDEVAEVPLSVNRPRLPWWRRLGG